MADNGKRGWRAMEWMRDVRGHQINNQPVRDTAVKAKAVSVVNVVFCRRVDHDGGRKAGSNGRAAVENRQQWQRKLGNNQLKVMVASGGIDSRGGGGR